VLNANRCCVEAADTLDGDMQATPEFVMLWCDQPVLCTVPTRSTRSAIYVAWLYGLSCFRNVAL